MTDQELWDAIERFRNENPNVLEAMRLYEESSHIYERVRRVLSGEHLILTITDNRSYPIRSFA